MQNKIENKEFLAKEIIGFKNGTAIFWKFDNIEIAKIDSNISIPDLGEIKELRFFDETKELFVWRVGSELFFREKSDSSNLSHTPVSSTAILRGSIAKKVGAVYTDLKEKTIAISKMDYIGYNDVGAAGYVDTRFVKFVKFNENGKV